MRLKQAHSTTLRSSHNPPNLRRFGFIQSGIKLKDLSARWLELKRMEITGNSHLRYVSYIKICTEILGPEKTISGVSNEDVLLVRKELLTGYQTCGKHQKNRAAKKVVLYGQLTST